MEDIRG